MSLHELFLCINADTYPIISMVFKGISLFICEIMHEFKLYAQMVKFVFLDIFREFQPKRPVKAGNVRQFLGLLEDIKLPVKRLIDWSLFGRNKCSESSGIFGFDVFKTFLSDTIFY